MLQHSEQTHELALSVVPYATAFRTVNLAAYDSGACENAYKSNEFSHLRTVDPQKMHMDTKPTVHA
jgi:hypothetical protein